MKFSEWWVANVQFPPLFVYWGSLVVHMVLIDITRRYVWGAALFGLGAGALCVWVYSKGVLHGENETIRYFVEAGRLKSIKPPEPPNEQA